MVTQRAYSVLLGMFHSLLLLYFYRPCCQHKVWYPAIPS